MTPEQRLDRAERIIILMAKAGYRARKEMREQLREHARWQTEHSREQAERSREQDEKINMLIQAQMETSELVKGLAVGHARLEEEMAKLAEADRRMREMFLSERKRRNGKSD